jgi:hypothetical protein
LQHCTLYLAFDWMAEVEGSYLQQCMKCLAQGKNVPDLALSLQQILAGLQHKSTAQLVGEKLMAAMSYELQAAEKDLLCPYEATAEQHAILLGSKADMHSYEGMLDTVLQDALKPAAEQARAKGCLATPQECAG